MAATVAAGIDGLVNKLECPSGASTFHKDDTRHLSASAADQKLPGSLSEALDCLQNDQAMCDALGEEFVRWFVVAKRERDIAHVSKAADLGKTELEVERDMYLKFV